MQQSYILQIQYCKKAMREKIRADLFCGLCPRRGEIEQDATPLACLTPSPPPLIKQAICELIIVVCEQNLFYISLCMSKKRSEKYRGKEKEKKATYFA